MRRKSEMRLSLSAFVIAAWTISVAGQTKPQTSLPSVDGVLARYEKAVGGKAAFEKLTSRVSKGIFEMPSLGDPGTTEIYQKAPNKYLTVTDVPNFGVVRSGVDGTAAWLETPQAGVQDLSGSMGSAMVRQAEFGQQVKLKELYPKMTVKGKESLDGHDVVVIEATPADGSPELLSFDAGSGLLVRSQSQVDGPQGSIDIDTRLGDYREVDGVKLPFEIQQLRSDFSFTIKIKEVKHNVAIDDAKFQKPKNE